VVKTRHAPPFPRLSKGIARLQRFHIKKSRGLERDKLFYAEEAAVAKHITEKDRKAGFENVEWALLNWTEFLVNH
jgi:hypothetical protein